MIGGIINLERITIKEVEELEQILKELNELIGGEANTGGTATAGTVMAKLNRLLTDWTTTRAEKIDTINTCAKRLTNTRADYLDKLEKFGGTEDTGGTATAGTLMAKLNKLLTNWTATRAEYLDLLNRGVGIKSVQRGFFSVNIKNGIPSNPTDEIAGTYTITLSTIVPSKTFILTAGKMFNTNGTISDGAVEYVGTTFFRYAPGFAGSANGSYTVRWQAIEFY